jgi:hypothetical protein
MMGIGTPIIHKRHERMNQSSFRTRHHNVKRGK